MVTSLIQYIVKKLVDKTSSVAVNEIEAGGKSVIQVRVASQDLSRVIGSEGRTFKALRTVVQVMSPGHRDLVIDSAE